MSRSYTSSLPFRLHGGSGTILLAFASPGKLAQIVSEVHTALQPRRPAFTDSCSDLAGL
jgi:hypothetical protein